MNSTAQIGRRQTLGGWGRFPVEPCDLFEPASLDALGNALRANPPSSFIARGLGRAYGDSALNLQQGVVATTRLNRFLAFDETTGVLECEAGVSFDEVIHHFLPRGWFLPVTPGTRFITMGGALAADIHGKNHHHVGSFSNFVRGCDLLLADGTSRHCSPTQEPELFWATAGGMGLTGVITRVGAQLIRVPSGYCHVVFRRTRDLDETLDCFADMDQHYQYSVAWIDCLAKRRSLGRSVVMLANDATPAELPSNLRAQPHSLPRRRHRRIPCNLPRVALNSGIVRAFNALYYAAHPNGQRLVDFNKFFYPLDGLLNWNRLYGRRGFVQFQALLPPETSRAGLVALLEEVAESRRASFLAVLKSCGTATPGILSYLFAGHTLALDFANTGSDLRLFLRKLEEVLLRHGGRLYLAKDSTMTADALVAMYPRLDEFRRLKKTVDPENRFQSSQARRLRLVECP